MIFEQASNRIYKEEGGILVAEITFPEVKKGLVNLNHTYVHPSMRGQGMAEKLLLEAIEVIKKNNCKAIATCPYVVDWFEKNPQYSEIYLKEYF